MILFSMLLLQIVTISLRDPVPPDSWSVQNVVVCNQTTKVSFAFDNDWASGKRGKVSNVTISGAEIPGVAEYLTRIAHNRAIQSITVRQCGPTRSELRISAEMELSEVGSKRDGLPKLHFFKFNENGLVKP